MRSLLPITLIYLLASPGAGALSQPVNPFPEPASMRHQVDFWQRVYVEIDLDAGFIHDNRRLDVVYETIALGSPERSRRSERQIRERKRHWRAVLERLAGAPASRGPDARRALAAWEAALGRAPRAAELRAAAGRLRFQRGQRRKFAAGLVRSGAYERRMRVILAAHGVPSDLAYLPHVESSFDWRAYSKSGAAGMWQFMRSTGRQYMVIDQAVDERLSPLTATRAAARLLRDNHARLGSWPLAITAYNHGAGGMRRAQKQLASSDIAEIVARYRGRAFGFASRNFYAQFLAARRLARNPEPHFGRLSSQRPERVDVVRLDFYADIRDLERELGVPRKRLQVLNPALRPAVSRSEKYVPRGFELRLPPDTLRGGAKTWLASLPAAVRHPAQRPSRYHVVRRGETLGHIARRNSTTVARLVALNGLSNKHRIRIGQKLELAAGAAKPAAEPRRAKRRAVPVPATLEVAAPSRDVAPAAAVAVAVAIKVPAAAPLSAEPARPLHWRRLDGEWTVVGHDETIGHFADWLEVSNARMRQLNGLSGRRQLRMGQRLKLDFSRVGAEDFLIRRAAHHAGIEARFFSRYSVVGTKVHTLRQGENLWVLSNQVYEVPTWLLHQHNADSVLRRLAPGAQISIPVLEPII